MGCVVVFGSLTPCVKQVSVGIPQSGVDVGVVARIALSQSAINEMFRYHMEHSTAVRRTSMIVLPP